jgi:hypothetical protein
VVAEREMCRRRRIVCRPSSWQVSVVCKRECVCVLRGVGLGWGWVHECHALWWEEEMLSCLDDDGRVVRLCVVLMTLPRWW